MFPGFKRKGTNPADSGGATTAPGQQPTLAEQIAAASRAARAAQQAKPPKPPKTPVQRPPLTLNAWRPPSVYDLKRAGFLAVMGGPLAAALYGAKVLAPSALNLLKIGHHILKPYVATPLKKASAIGISAVIGFVGAHPIVKGAYDLIAGGLSPNSPYMTNFTHMGVAGIASHALFRGASDSHRAGGDAVDKASNLVTSGLGHFVSGSADVGGDIINGTVADMAKIANRGKLPAPEPAATAALNQSSATDLGILDDNQTVTVCELPDTRGDQAATLRARTGWDKIANALRGKPGNLLNDTLYASHGNVSLILRDFRDASDGQNAITVTVGQGCPSGYEKTTYSAVDWVGANGLRPQ